MAGRRPPPGEQQPQEPARTPERWSLLIPHRQRLLRFARLMGAGDDSEDVVHETLLAVAGHDHLDEQRVWSLLANILTKRIADRYRRFARAEILVHHRGLLSRPRQFEHDVVDRAEAAWVAEQLVRTLPAEIMDLLWRHHVGGATWAELAAQHRESVAALRQRVARTLRKSASPDRSHAGLTKGSCHTCPPPNEVQVASSPTAQHRSVRSRE